ncbi:serine/threonine protein kinase [Micromonospora sp. BL4]|uniref:serine/threonine-protein kinase n=1 Tax=Micromonospora sp. BL4 TaxID=2478710 RepID=UPI000EF5D9AB|nr:serine/threonine-protein kinase [Micromonospora sp. BL4]RLP87282.1 serine/threonine protein kinase [Micromonospora sp. BL4]
MTQIPTWSGGQVSPANGRAAPGTTIGGRYSLRSSVGNGGMGTVWRATDTLLRRDVAVKEVVLPPGLAPSDRDAMYERTLREARAAAAIQHPAVVQVYDVVTEAGRPWIVMELLDARSLADMVIEDGPVAPRAVAKIGIALLGALEVAHAIGVLHRDVKPANVLICADGRCVLTDFGVARMPTDVQLTTPGMVLGSPHFISPERAMGQEFGPPSDLFSLGVTLYTAVEGRPPFDKGDPIETMHAVVEDPPAPPQRSGPLTRVLMGLLEKDPARRLDVHTSRAMLRELLAGPLGSTATAVHSVTDPYAVVPVQQRPAPFAPPAPPEPKPDSQIGGRAMLAPGESLTDRLASLRRGERPQPATAAGTTGLDETSADALAGPLHTPTGAMPVPGRPAAGRTYGGPADATQRVDAGGHPDATQRVSYGSRPDATQQVGYGGAPEATQRIGGTYGGGNQWSVPGTGQPWATPATSGGAGALDKVRATGGQLVTTVKGWPRKVQLAAAGGLALVLLLSVVALTSGGDDPAPTTPQAQPTQSAAAGPAMEMQEHAARGIEVMVPKGWTKATGGVYFDYVDPEDRSRKVRVLTEDFSTTSMRWAEVAEGGLKKAKSCPKPYNRIAMAEKDLAGKPAAEFEYTCGEGDTQRHGIWRGVVTEGKVYSFYLSSNDAKFAESKPIFDEMVRTFQLTGNG